MLSTLAARAIGSFRSSCFVRSPAMIGVMLGVSVFASSDAFAQRLAGGSSPLGSGFTYQGVLKSAGAPYSGLADLRFQMFYESAGGPAVAPASIYTGQTIIDGQFTVTLDFGTADFAGEERWLAIEVCAPSTSGAGPWTPLTPRQRIAPVPYAIHAMNAFISGAQPNMVQFGNAANQYFGSLMNIDSGTLRVDPVLDAVGMGVTPDSASRLRVAAAGNDYAVTATANGTGAAIGALQADPAGHAAYFEGRTALMGPVGIGTVDPQDHLHILDGGIIVDPFPGGFSLLHMDGASTIGGLGESSGGGFFMGNYSAGPLVFGTQTTPGSAFERMRIAPGGNVGIGTPGPQNRLDVEGSAAIGAAYSGTNAAPANSLIVEGNIGAGVTDPTARVHIGGTPGSVAVRYPDNSIATKAPTALFASSFGADPTTANTFLSGTVTIQVTSTSQQFLVHASKAFGSTAAGGGQQLDLYIGHQLSGSGAISLIGGGIFDVTVAQNQRQIFSLSAIITDLSPGSYVVGMCGSTPLPAGWNSNEYSYVTVTSLN